MAAPISVTQNLLVDMGDLSSARGSSPHSRSPHRGGQDDALLQHMFRTCQNTEASVNSLIADLNTVKVELDAVKVEVKDAKACAAEAREMAHRAIHAVAAVGGSSAAVSSGHGPLSALPPAGNPSTIGGSRGGPGSTASKNPHQAVEVSSPLFQEGLPVHARTLAVIGGFPPYCDAEDTKAA